MSGTRNDPGFSGGIRENAGGDRSRDVDSARRPFSLAAAFVSVLLLAYAGASHAALGGLPEQFNAEGAAVASTVSSTMSNYVVRDTNLTTGTRVREYIAGSGLVFAVTWEGPVLPDLKALLGKYFDAMAAESKRMPRAGRSHLGVNLPEVVINSGGHMRAFHGSAWIPAQFPAGFSADDVR